MRTDPMSQPIARAISVEPSRAWILGLVVEPDGSVAAPLPHDEEWPSAPRETPREIGVHHIKDGSTVRP